MMVEKGDVVILVFWLFFCVQAKELESLILETKSTENKVRHCHTFAFKCVYIRWAFFL